MEGPLNRQGNRQQPGPVGIFGPYHNRIILSDFRIPEGHGIIGEQELSLDGQEGERLEGYLNARLKTVSPDRVALLDMQAPIIQ
ncbi:hypothetical protein FACS189491_12300 [Spirochaetia bacterium]|nr:hypothetical protein FACS189491_12300 [Spirochaetia bacterium]